MQKESYKRYVKRSAPKSPVLKNCLFAFFTGGLICTLGQGLTELYSDMLKMEIEEARAWCSVTLIFAAAVLTGIGVFDNIARHAGAGTLVPITGFANSVVSEAIDSKSEGFIMGVGAKIFTVAGPVLLYGTLSGCIYGALYYVISLL